MRARMLLSCVALVAACGRGEAADAPRAADAFRPLAAGEPVPAYAVATTAGDTVRVGPGAGGGYTLLNVWATWCATCEEEFADLERMARDYAPRGLRVVAVSVDQGATARVERFASDLGVTFPIAHDPEGRIKRAFSLVGVPETFLIGPDGRLVKRFSGALPKGAAEARNEIERALGVGR